MIKTYGVVARLWGTTNEVVQFTEREDAEKYIKHCKNIRPTLKMEIVERGIFENLEETMAGKKEKKM